MTVAYLVATARYLIVGTVAGVVLGFLLHPIVRHRQRGPRRDG